MPRPAILVLLVIVAGLASPASAAPRPNIVVILVDDMGFSDIGCYGGEIRTPHLDALAAGGLRFTQFYNTARCCPTRAALLTGLYPHQAGVGHMVDDKGLDGYRGELSRQAPTIAEVLRAAGYSTAMVGKWHVTRRLPPDGPKDNWPVARGFDRYFGTIRGAGSYFSPAGLVRDDTPVREPDAGYVTDAFADQAATFIDDHCRSAPERPLFLYAAFTAPHWPLHAPADVVARYRGSYAAGWEKIRAARHARQVEMGLVDATWPLSPSPRSGAAWDRLDPAQRDELDQRMAIYAAQVDRMDEGVGRIVAALRRNGRLDTTLILFLSDNGGCAEGGMLGGGPAKQLGTHAGYMLSYGEAWANVSNTPFREYKHFVHEGGIATPLVAHWPAGIARRGELERQPGHLIDIMATCLDVAGAEHPAAWQGAPTTPPEGRSLVPAFAGRRIERDALFWEHEGNRAVRIGDWKLVAKGPKGRWQLYDLAQDRTELHDLAEREPERVRDMAAAWETWAVRAKAKPWPWDRDR